MAAFNFLKTTQQMTAKERAKLVIKLQLQSLKNVTHEEIQDYENGLRLRPDPPENYEIRHLVATCPQDQASNYNFLIQMQRLVWDRIADKIRDRLISLELLNGSSAAMRYQLSCSPVIHYAIENLDRHPVLVKKQDYDEAVKNAMAFKRGEALSLEGNYNLSQQEAYYRLVKENKVVEGDLDGYLLFINNHGRTEEELLTKKVQEIKQGIEEYLKVKEKLGGDEPSFDYFSRYVGLSDEELREKAKQDYPGHFDIPSKEEAELWFKTAQEEKERLLTAVGDKKLLAKGDGVELGSYYDWGERYQKFAGEKGAEERGWNPLREDCIEMGFSEGKIISSSEHLSEREWKNIVVVTPHEEIGFGGKIDIVNSYAGNMASFLKMMNFFEVSEKDFSTRKRTIKISSTQHDELLKSFVMTASQVIVDIYSQLALIEEIENKYFDGMETIERDGDFSSFSISMVKKRVNKFIETHNESINDILLSFNRFGSGFWVFEFEGMENYLIPNNLQSDVTWVERKLRQVESESR